MFKEIIITILILSSTGSCFASSNQDVVVPPFMDIFRHLPENWNSFKDKTIDPENLWVVSGVMASTALFIAYDYELWKESERWKNANRNSEVWHWAGVSMGDGYFQFVTAGVFGALGYLASDNLMLRTSSQIVEVILSTGAVVQILKHYTGRESPFKATERTGHWEPFPEQSQYYRDVQNYDAVPSGHIATFYATFLVIMDNYPNQKWIPYAGYTLTALVAEGLAGTSLHWWSDFPIGLALGHVFAKIVTARNHPEENKKLGIAWDQPYVHLSPSKFGAPLLNLGWRW